MTPIFVPIPSGNWSIGPSLFYLFSVVGILIYLVITTPRSPKKGPTPEQIDERLREQRKQEAFYKALSDASKERKKGTP